jgi:hypothetical protein
MKITVKELIELLKEENQDFEIHFGGLEFNRLKDRGTELQFQFNQLVYQDEKGDVVVQNY